MPLSVHRNLLLVALLLATVRPAWPWGCQGHEIVAYIASRHLTSKAKSGVSSLIGHPTSVIHVHRFCTVRGLSAMANVSSWADDERGVNRATAPWHFLDIPRGTPASTDP